MQSLPLWIVDLDAATREPLNRHLIERIYALTEPRQPVAPGGSWQTDPTLHDRPDFADFATIAAKTAPLRG